MTTQSDTVKLSFDENNNRNVVTCYTVAQEQGILLRQPNRYMLFMKQFILLKYQHKKEPVVVNAAEMSIIMSHPNIFRGFTLRVCDMKVHNASKI